MSAFTHYLSYDFKNGLRDKSLLLMNYLFPLGLFIMMGFLMGAVNPAFNETIIPAMIIVAIMSIALLGMPNPIVSDRTEGVYRSFKINGIPAAHILSVPPMGNLLHILLVSAIITALAIPLFSAGLPVNWAFFIGVDIAAFFAMAGLGMLIGVISSNPRATILYSQIFFLPSMILSGLMITFDMLSLLLPATHAMNAFRGLAYGWETSFSAVWSLVILLAGGLIAFGLAIFLFQWDNHNPNRRLSPFLAILVLVPYLIAVLLY
jgi:ABC-2 type transport system permease protein